MPEKEHAIGKATLIKIERGVFTFEYEDGKQELIWGWNSPSNCKVGDTGMMVYRSTPSYGLPLFIKDLRIQKGGENGEAADTK